MTMLLKFMEATFTEDRKDYIVEKFLKNEMLYRNKPSTLRTLSLIKRREHFRNGFLLFREKELDVIMQNKIITKFEKTFFAGLDKSHYAIMWSKEYSDSQVKLVFITISIHLGRLKPMNINSIKLDKPLKKSFESIINTAYDLESGNSKLKNKKSLRIELTRYYKLRDVKLKKNNKEFIINCINK